MLRHGSGSVTAPRMNWALNSKFGKTRFGIVYSKDESHNSKNWCMMAVSKFKPLLFVRGGVYVAQIRKALGTSYVLPCHQNF